MQKQINQLIHLPFWPKMGWVIFFAIFGTFSLTTTPALGYLFSGSHLYEMLTGKVPFEGEMPFSIGIKNKSERPKDPRELNSQIPEDHSRVILKCLEKNPEKRYQSAQELHSELENIEKGIPITEVPTPTSKPTTSKEVTVTFKKNWLGASVPFAVVILIGIGLLLL